MTEALLSVALLFDDAELGSHLRQALVECGVRVVHEGPLASLDGGLLHQVNPDVLVVNLDDDDDEAFENLYSLIEGGRPRLVFNDAQASRALSGWDRARWARHLAVKVLAEGDLDPPRPQDAREVEVAPAMAAPSVDVPEVVEPTPGEALGAASDADEAGVLAVPHDETPLEGAAEEPAHPAPDEFEGSDLPADAATQDAHDEASHHFTSDDLEAELAALLAAESLPLESKETQPPPTREFLPLNDGNFGEPIGLDAPAVADPAAPEAAAPAPAVAVAAAPIQPPAAPAGWALVDHDAAPPVAENRPSAGDFGIEKMSAADFLAPESEAGADVQPTFSLELVSMEEAVAPQTWEPREMLLDDLDAVPTRVVLLGAAVDGLASVGDFLAALPASSSLTLVLVQHYGGQTADAVLQQLAAQSKLPVRLAQTGRARAGEVLLAPMGARLQLRRDGSVEMSEPDGAAEASIDGNFSAAASSFGRDALGIVFAGRSTDAVAGAQAIHDRGGKIWAESSSGEHHGDMVGALYAEHLVSFSGSPHELAAHLSEVYA